MPQTEELNLEAVGSLKHVVGGMTMPTLVVGLGGTGSQVVRRVRKFLRERYGKSGLIKFVCIDSDQGLYEQQAGLSAPPGEEVYQCLLSVRRPDQILREIRQGEPKPGYEETRLWLMDNLRVSQLAAARGAGTIRPAGRFAFFLSFNQVLGSLTDAVNELSAIPAEAAATEEAQIEGMSFSSTKTVFVVSSLCGGTGSGIFADVCVLLRHLLSGQDFQMIGIFALPSVFYSVPEIVNDPRKQALLQANAYAALEELEEFLSDEGTDGKWTFTYPNIGTIPLTAPLLDRCFLVEGRNSQGATLTTKEQAFELIAHTLVSNCRGPLGHNHESRLVDMQSWLAVTPCPITKKPRIFSTMSSCAIVFPWADILNYCCLRKSGEAVADRLLGQVLMHKECEEMVDAWLTEHELDDREPRNMVINRLRKDSSGETITSEVCQLDTPDVAKEQFLQGYETEKQTLEADVLPEIEQTMVDSRNRIEQAALNAIRTEVNELFRTKGSRTALGLISALITAFTVMREQMVKERKDWALGKTAAMDSLQSLNADLQGYGGFIDVLFRPRVDDRIKKDMANQFAALVENEIMDRARGQAAGLLGAILSSLERIRSSIQALSRELERLEIDLDQSVNGYASSQRRMTGSYELEVPAVDFEYYKGYYAEHPVDPETVLKHLEEQRGDSEKDLFEVLSPLPALEIGQLLLEAAANSYKPDLEQVNVVDVLGEASQKNKETAAVVKARLNWLFSVAQPFWQLRLLGELQFEETFCIGVPATMGKTSAEVQATVEKWVRDLAAARAGTQIRPAIIPTGYPHALEVSRWTHGARGFYLAEVDRWNRQYVNMETDKSFPLCTDKRFTSPPMAELMPTAEDQRLQFTLGMAYGLIAQRGNYYAFGIYEDTRADEVLCKYRSDNRMIADLSGGWGFQVYINPATGKPIRETRAEERIARTASRTQAMNEFLKKPDWVNQVRELVEQHHQIAGTDRYRRELETYITEVLEPAIIQKGANLEQLTLERDLLRKHVLSLAAAL